MTKIFKSQFGTIDPEIEFAKEIVGDSVEITERILKELLDDIGLNITYKINGGVIELRWHCNGDYVKVRTADLLCFTVSKQEGTELRPVPYIQVGTNCLYNESDVPWEYSGEDYIEMFLTGDFEADLRKLLSEFILLL